MADTYNLKNISQTAKRILRSELLIPARVIDVILDESHPEFDKYGKWLAIGAIKYTILGKSTKASSKSEAIAYPLHSHIKHIPLKNEIVLIVSAASENQQSSATSNKDYYLDIINIWNHPHHNAHPGLNVNPSLGDDFQEAADINPMLPFEGDIIVEGRQGQSLRFSTGIPNKTPWQGSTGNPITIISNGQVSTDEGYTYITEDVNQDFSSIYLTSNQKIQLEPAQEFSLFSPQVTKDYEGNQFLANSNRITLNGRDNILATATNDIGLKSSNIYLEASSNLTADASRIQLGSTDIQPVLKGDDTVTLLKSLISELRSLGAVLTLSASPATVANLADAGTSLVERAISLEGKLVGLKSKKTFTE